MYDLLVPKDGAVSDIFPILQNKLELSDEEAERIRIYEAHSGKIFKSLTENYPIASVNEFMTLYAELIPLEEWDADETYLPIACFHFDKEPTKTHGVPFYFVIKEVSSLGTPLWSLTLINSQRANYSAIPKNVLLKGLASRGPSFRR